MNITKEQANLIGRLLFEFRIKSLRLAAKAEASVEYADLRGRFSGYAESRRRRHLANAAAAEEILRVVSCAKDSA